MAYTGLRTPSVIAAALPLVLFAQARGGNVDMELTPIDDVVEVCEIIEVNLVVSSDDVFDQPFDALDAILTWDPSILELDGIDDSNAGATFFVSDFLPDPDGVNDDILDGEALYTALAPAGNPVDAPGAPGELIVTTFRFTPLVTSTATTLSFTAAVGDFGLTRVLLEGATITGDITDDASVQAGTCTADFDANGAVEFADLLRLLSAWGPCGTCCPEDIDGNNDVAFPDLLFLLAKWGPCP